MCAFFDANDPNDKKQEADVLNRLREAGAVLSPAPSRGPQSVFTVCHQKLVIADGRRVCLGSANWGKTGFPEQPKPATFKQYNREWVIAVEDVDLGRWWTELFEADWALAARPAPQGVDVTVSPADIVEIALPTLEAAPAPPGPFAPYAPQASRPSA